MTTTLDQPGPDQGNNPVPPIVLLINCKDGVQSYLVAENQVLESLFGSKLVRCSIDLSKDADDLQWLLEPDNPDYRYKLLAQFEDWSYRQLERWYGTSDYFRCAERDLMTAINKKSGLTIGGEQERTRIGQVPWDDVLRQVRVVIMNSELSQNPAFKAIMLQWLPYAHYYASPVQGLPQRIWHDHNPAAEGPICFTCGTRMRPAGRAYVCEGCGSTSVFD